MAAVVDSTAKGELPFGIYFEPLATDYYYRYSVDMLPIFLAEVATILVIIFTTFKVARLSYELVIHRLFAEILALTDLAGGSKLREVLKLIGATYIVLAYCPVAVRLFLSFQNWMFGTDSPFGDSIIPSFLLLAIAMAVIDGPNLIERIFSIDAGIQSGFKAAMAAVGIGRMASGTLHGLAHGVSSIGKGVNRFADSRRTTPTAKDKRSALRSSRTWDYVNAYKDGENAANDTAKRHGSSGLKSQTTAGKKQGIQDASRKLFTNSRQAAAQLFKDNGLTSSSDSLNPASSGTMSADAISSEQEKQGAEANLQKIIVAIMTLISGIVAAISGANSGNSSEYTNAAYGQAYDLSDNTQMFVAELYTACENYDVLHWFEALKAIMEIESGGEGPEWADRMCCSESQQNYEYPRYPGSITSVAYSMDAGVRTWISLCEYTGLTDASQESLLLATVQCYNFGPGFWDYLTSDESKYYGEFTPIAAETYQQYYRDKYGWTPGNAEYTDRFREHYKFPRELSFDTGGGSMISGAFDGTIGWPIEFTTCTTYSDHLAVDIGTGTTGYPVYAVGDGVVIWTYRKEADCHLRRRML